MATVTICSDFGAPENKVWHCFHCFPILLPWSDGTRCHDVSFLNVKLLNQLFILLLHFHQEAFSSPLLSAIRVVPSAYLSLLIFLLAILIPACASSSPVFLMMYSAYKLNKVAIYSFFFPNFESVFYSLSGSNCCFLTYIQVSQEAGQVVWYSHLLRNFPHFVLLHTAKGFSIVNEAEGGILLEFSCFSYDSMDVGNLISGYSAFSKSSFYIWKF